MEREEEHLALRIITAVVIIGYNRLLAYLTLTGLPVSIRCAIDWDPRTHSGRDETAVNIWPWPCSGQSSPGQEPVRGLRRKEG